jgi:DNA-binding CsgD family transcriptional regulator
VTESDGRGILPEDKERKISLDLLPGPVRDYLVETLKSCGYDIVSWPETPRIGSPEYSVKPTKVARKVLSERDSEIVRAFATHRTTREVALKVGYSYSTVEQRMTKLYKQMQVKGRAELLVFLAANPGYLHPNSRGHF